MSNLFLSSALEFDFESLLLVVAFLDDSCIVAYTFCEKVRVDPDVFLLEFRLV